MEASDVPDRYMSLLQHRVKHSLNLHARRARGICVDGFAVAVENHEAGDAFDLVGRHDVAFPFAGKKLDATHVFLAEHGFPFVVVLSGVDRHAHEHDVRIVVILLLQLHHVGNLHLAGGASSGPDVDIHHFALEVGQSHLLSIDILKAEVGRFRGLWLFVLGSQLSEALFLVICDKPPAVLLAV